MAESSWGVQQIALERKRQMGDEGYDEAHDDAHTHGELAQAAECYTSGPRKRPSGYNRPPQDWPWRRDEWKPGDRQSDLIKAGALIAAELDRLHRAEKQASKSK